MNDNFWEEVFKLVAEYDRTRPKLVQEYRLYYDNNGNVLGLWESGHPQGDNFIVLDDPGIFYHTNTSLLKVKNKKLVVIDPTSPNRIRLKKGYSEFKVVKGHASLLIEGQENYTNVEYYDRTDN